MATLLTSRLKHLRRKMGIRPIDQEIRDEDESKLNLKIAQANDGAADGLERVLENYLAGRGHGTSSQPLDVPRIRSVIAKNRADAAELRRAAGVDE